MPSLTEAINAAVPPVTADGSHGNHSAPSGTTGNSGAGSSFAEILSQAAGQSPVAANHGNHGGFSGSSPHGGHGGVGMVPSSSDPHPGHVPLAGSHGREHSFQQIALGLRAYRQQVIASNIANADTPNYKAVDIDFQEATRIAQTAANSPALPLATPAAGHISGQATANAPPFPLKYHVPSQVSVDGNTVEMDVERNKLSENTVMYQFSLDRVSGHFKHLMELLKEL